MLKIDVTGLERWVRLLIFFPISITLISLKVRAREKNVQVKCTGIEDWSNEDRMPES